MVKFKNDKAIEVLSDDDLECLVSGGELSPKAKKILKWCGIGVTSAAILAGSVIGIAALVGWKTGKGKFSYLHDPFTDIPDNEESLKISNPSNFYHPDPGFSGRHPILSGLAKGLARLCNIPIKL